MGLKLRQMSTLKQEIKIPELKSSWSTGDLERTYKTEGINQIQDGKRIQTVAACIYFWKKQHPPAAISEQLGIN